jgi:hypothetical protein
VGQLRDKEQQGENKMLPKAYLQSLDTVNFDSTKHRGGNLRVAIDESYAKTMIYSAFYEIVLSPNQVLDLSLLRQPQLDPSKDLAAYPFTFSVGSGFINSPTPFTSHLVFILRYEGSSAFLFSSLNNNWLLKKNWGDFMSASSKSLSDGDLLIEAKKTAYGEIVEWAEKLDREARKLLIAPYEPSRVLDFQGVFSSFLDDTANHLGWLPNLPKNRSEAYELIDKVVKDETVKALSKQVPDFVSNTLYANAVNARLSIDSTSALDIDAKATNKLRIDLDGLFSKYGFALDALEGASYTDLSKARKKASSYMNQGWSLEKSDPEGAIKMFGKGLKEFLGDIVSKKYTETIMSVGVSAPIANMAVNIPASFIAKVRLAGIDKFVNFKD